MVEKHKKYHPCVIILEEMKERGWTSLDLALKMKGDWKINKLSLDLYFSVAPNRDDCRLGIEMSISLAQAFNVSPEFFLNLEENYYKKPVDEVKNAKHV